MVFEDLLLEIALWLAVGTIASVIVSGLMLVYIRYKHYRREKNRSLFEETWNPLLDQVCEAGESSLQEVPDLKRNNLILFLELWVNRYADSSSPEKTQLLKLADALDLLRRSETYVFSDSFREAITSIRAIGYLDSEWNSKLEETATSPNPYLSLEAVRSLLRINSEKAMDLLLQQLETRKNWPSNLVYGLLEETEVSGASRKLIDWLEAQDRPRLSHLRFLQTADPDQVIPKLQQWIQQEDDPDYRALYLHLFFVFGRAEGLEPARSCLGDDHWFVRLQAVRCIGKLGDESDLERLQPHLQDQHWWIRYRTAEALIQLPGVNRSDLQKILDEETDSYAKDVLHYFLGESPPSPEEPIITGQIP